MMHFLVIFSYLFPTLIQNRSFQEACTFKKQLLMLLYSLCGMCPMHQQSQGWWALGTNSHGPGAVPAALPFPVSHTGNAQVLLPVRDLSSSPAVAKDNLGWGSSG